jgi:hypothetical protein
LLTKYQTWNNRKSFWCCCETGGKCPGKWRVHKPRDCKGIPSKADRRKTKAKKGGNKGKADSLKIPIIKEAVFNKVRKETKEKED